MQDSLKQDKDSVVLLLRKISVKVAWLFDKMNITPNQVTFFRFFFVVLPAAGLFIVGEYWAIALALVLLVGNFGLDLVDGDLARNFDKKSALGHFIDSNLDLITLNVVILAIIVNAVLINSPYQYIMMLALFAQPISGQMTTIFKNTFHIDCVEGNIELDKKLSIFSFTEKAIISLISPSGFIDSLFSNIRYFLIIGVVFNSLPLAICVYAVLLNIRWITLFIVLSVFYATKENTRSKLFNYMKECL